MKTHSEENLAPNVQRIEIEQGMHYRQCKATVAVDISDGNGGWNKLVVEYPMQGDNHMHMLMKDKETGRDINHAIKLPIVKAINNAIKGGRE
jgi:hypothetical protein